MRIGMIRLGHMGGNMTLRILAAGHEVVTYARRRETLEPFVRQGAIPATTYDEFGQSFWLGYIRRHLLRSGQLATLIEQGLRGVTSNPAIFEQAIAGSTDYTDAIARMADRSTGEIYRELAIEDIRAAADLLRPVYDDAARTDGFVSLEVSPLLAHDTARTIDEAPAVEPRRAREPEG